MIYLYGDYYVESSYGIKCMYELIFKLNFCGYPARLICFRENNQCPIPDKFKQIFIPKEKIPKITPEDVVIYPESINGNPLGAKNVIRWLLNRSALLTGEKISYSDSDLLVSYSKHICDYIPQLFFLIDERELFDRIRKWKTSQKKKTLSVYFGKVHLDVLKEMNEELQSIIADYEEINIITRAFPSTREQTLEMIAQSDLLISYDGLSNLNYEAALIGTPVVMMDDSFDTKNKSFNVIRAGIYYSYQEYINSKDTIDINSTYIDYCRFLDNQKEYLEVVFGDIFSAFYRIDNDKEYLARNMELNKNIECQDVGLFNSMCRESPFIGITNIEDIPYDTLIILNQKNTSENHIIISRNESKRNLFIKRIKIRISAWMKKNGTYDMVKSWKDGLYMKSPSSLTVKELAYLFFRRLIRK